MKLMRICIETDCPSRKRGDPVEHEVYGIQKGEETPFGRMNDQYQVRCSACSAEKLEYIPRVSKKKRHWPHYNASTGVTFQSESHEKKYVKENNLDAL